MEGVKTIKNTALKGLNKGRDKIYLLETKARAGIAPEGERAYIETVVCNEIDKATKKSMLFQLWFVKGRATGEKQ